MRARIINLIDLGNSKGCKIELSKINNLQGKENKKMDTKNEGILQKKAMLISYSSGYFRAQKKDERIRKAAAETVSELSTVESSR